jgi:hypothetical protein
MAYSMTSRTRKIFTEQFVYLEFINTEKLSFMDFCNNLMAAQAFSGNYCNSDLFDAPINPFIGIIDFTIDDFKMIHPLVVHSNCNMMHCYLLYNNVLTSLDNVILANYKQDIIAQKKYLSKTEYTKAMKQLKEDRKCLEELMDGPFDYDELNDPEFGMFGNQ